MSQNEVYKRTAGNKFMVLDTVGSSYCLPPYSIEKLKYSLSYCFVSLMLGYSLLVQSIIVPRKFVGQGNISEQNIKTEFKIDKKIRNKRSPSANTGYL